MAGCADAQRVPFVNVCVCVCLKNRPAKRKMLLCSLLSEEPSKGPSDFAEQARPSADQAQTERRPSAD